MDFTQQIMQLLLGSYNRASLYDNEATRNVVDTNYKYTFNDGTNDISVGVSTSTTTD